MAICTNCGQELEDNAAFCGKCGTPQTAVTAADTNAKVAAAKEAVAKVLDTPDYTASHKAEDVEGGKLMGILCYLSWLVLVPLFMAKQSAFVRFHANQGLILAILGTVYGVVAGVVCGLASLIWGVLGSILGWLFGLAGLVLLALAVLGIVNVVTGKAKELPYIGKYQILD